MGRSKRAADAEFAALFACRARPSTCGVRVTSSSVEKSFTESDASYMFIPTGNRQPDGKRSIYTSINVKSWFQPLDERCQRNQHDNQRAHATLSRPDLTR